MVIMITMIIIDYEKPWRGRLDCLEERSFVGRVKREWIGKEKATARRTVLLVELNSVIWTLQAVRKEGGFVCHHTNTFFRATLFSLSEFYSFFALVHTYAHKVVSTYLPAYGDTGRLPTREK